MFDERGEIISISQPAADSSFQYPPELASVLQTGEAVEFIRRAGGKKNCVGDFAASARRRQNRRD